MTRDELLMKLYDEQTTHARHHEALRVNFVSIVLTLGGVLLAVVGWDNGVTAGDFPAIAFLFVLGLFGAVASMKHYERNRMHVRRARIMRELAEKTLDQEDIGPSLYTARKDHESDYPFLSKRIRLKTLWTAAPLLLSVAALVVGVSVLIP